MATSGAYKGSARYQSCLAQIPPETDSYNIVHAKCSALSIRRIFRLL